MDTVTKETTIKLGGINGYIVTIRYQDNIVVLASSISEALSTAKQKHYQKNITGIRQINGPVLAKRKNLDYD